MIETPMYLPEVRCEASAGGILPDGVTARILGADGRRQAVQVTPGLINRHDGVDYLPVGIVEINRKLHRVLIELPTEADSGANRMWVRFDDLRREAVQETEMVS
jgi:hypothetical protein